MLFIDPTSVSFAGITLDNVESIAIDRAATGPTIHHGDGGPHPTFCDCPIVRTTIRITQRIDLSPPQQFLAVPTVGQLDVVRFLAQQQGGPPSTGRSVAGRAVSIKACLIGIAHELTPGPVPSASATRAIARRTLTLIGTATASNTDPVSFPDR